MNDFFSKEEIAGFSELEPIKKRRAATKQRPLTCNDCGLYRKCESPKMKPHGKFKRQGMIWGEAPGETEDLKGRQFVGKAGKRIRDTLDKFDVSFDRDCVAINSIDCRPTDKKGNNRTPTTTEIKACYSRKVEALEKDVLVIKADIAEIKEIFKGHGKRITHLEEISSK